MAALLARAELLVSSYSSNRVFRYSEVDGSFIDIFVPSGTLSLPHGLAFGPDGNLYVASAGNSRVDFSTVSPVWSAVVHAVTKGGGNFQMTIPRAGNRQFFRLMKP
jgi:DNA-binding beta-propeller fold protein YncE